MKDIQNYERACTDIKTEKAQKQDWDGSLETKALPHKNPT